MEEKPSPPPARTRKARPKPTAHADESSPAPAKPRRRRAAPENGGPSGTDAAHSSPTSDRGTASMPPMFDHLMDDDGFVRDFDRLASENPKSAVLTALAVGVAIGFVAALLLARD